MLRSATQCCGSIVLIIALCLACAPAPTQALNHTQIEVLKLFYNTTNGASWVNNSGWTTPQHLWGDPCNDTGEPFPTLFGVTCGAGQIQVFMMQTNNLDGTIPPTFFIEHDQLVTLLLNGNPKLTGQLPDFAYEAPLGTVLLSGCALTGTIPPSLFTFALTELEIDNNQLTGGMPDSVGNSTLMTLFTFGQNKLNIGPFPGSIVNCTQITSFSGIGSGITQLPDDFYLLNQTITLNLQDNRLEGTFPESWCKITSLVSLFLQDNPNLKGTLPECIGNWTQLVNLVIENTAMSGTIPNATFTANFSSTLTQLVLSGLTGGIPDLFNVFSSLQFVVLNGDNSKRNPPYSGPFPNTLIQLSSLISLSIQYTNIESPQTDFSLLTSLQILTLSSNPKMSMTLPSEILTSIWNVPSPTGPGSFAPGTVQRSLLIANMPLNGSLPHITNTVYNMSTFGGFAFDETDLVGYIPNSTFNWIPNSTHFSRKGLFAHCKYLLYPVRDWMLELTDNYAGYQFTITGIEGQSTFSYAGGELLTITGSNFLYLPDNIYCGFCVSGNISVCEQTEWASQHEMNESLAFSPGNQTYENKIICETPIVDNNIPVQVYIFYVGLAYSDTEEEFYRISSSSAVVNFYNPRPFLASLSPSFGRLEGCTTVIAIGSGFLNAPNMSLLISDVNNSIYVTGGVVINDTAAQFVVPHANSSAINAEYPFDLDFAIPVDMYVNGFEFPDQNATSNATYNFTKTCDSLLTPCADGFIDPEGCPDPLCMCFSQGNCMWTNATSNVSVHNNTYSFQCVCAEGFEGVLCQSCTPGFYGASCAPCECVHGTCLDGMDRDGECVCEGPWFGKTCDTSWVGVGVGVVLGAVGSFALVFYIRRRRRRADYEQSAIAMNATTPTGVKEVYGSA